jgi:hypothetical protein
MVKEFIEAQSCAMICDYNNIIIARVDSRIVMYHTLLKYLN